MLYKKALFLLLTICTTAIYGQKDFKNISENFSSIAFHFGSYIPGGDYDEYFGTHFQIGGKYNYKTKSNFSFGLEGSFIFGNKVESDGMLIHLRTEDNEVLDEDGKPSTILFFQRGFSFVPVVGKIFPKVFGQNPNSGLHVELGLGFLSHWVRPEHQNNRIYALDNEYSKGYDRKTTGLLVKQFIGYIHHSDNKLANFSAGFEFYQGFTKNRRDYNFDLGGPDKRSRLDLSYGIKVSWIIPLYTRMSSEYYIN